MNYITSCPKCDTHFLLNDELIKAHRGKVQCGSCEHIFNAKNRLTEVADDITSADDYQASLEESLETNQEQTSLEEIDVGTTNTEVAASIEIEETFTAKADNEDISSNTSTPVNPENSTSLSTPFMLDDFTRSLKPTKKTKRHTILFYIFGLLLILVAAIQTLYHKRVKVAAEYPQFKPTLVKACALVNCTIDLPKQLDLITIGDSDMQEDDGYKSVINFSSSLTNNANFPQAYPNIELTLTDIEDKIVIKKLIPPENYLKDKNKIKSGLAAHEISAVKLALYVKESSVAGYRILLVY